MDMSYFHKVLPEKLFLMTVSKFTADSDVIKRLHLHSLPGQGWGLSYVWGNIELILSWGDV